MRIKFVERIGTVNHQNLREGGKKKEIVNHINQRLFTKRPEELHFNDRSEIKGQSGPTIETSVKDNADNIVEDSDDDDDPPILVLLPQTEPNGNQDNLRRSQRFRRPPDYY